MQRLLLSRRLVALHVWQSRDWLRKPKEVERVVENRDDDDDDDDALPSPTMAKSTPSSEK